jgi:hypothetical protein
MKSGQVYRQKTDIDEFSSYREFIGYLESQNVNWFGELKYEEDR